MNSPISFDHNGASYQFISIDALEQFVLEHNHVAKQLSEAVDREIDLRKRQTFINSLAEVQTLIWVAGDLLGSLEAEEDK